MVTRKKNSNNAKQFNASSPNKVIDLKAQVKTSVYCPVVHHGEGQLARNEGRKDHIRSSGSSGYNQQRKDSDTVPIMQHNPLFSEGSRVKQISVTHPSTLGRPAEQRVQQPQKGKYLVQVAPIERNHDPGPSARSQNEFVFSAGSLGKGWNGAKHGLFKKI